MYISVEQISKYVEDSESQISHCWIKRLQICKGMRSNLVLLDGVTGFNMNSLIYIQIDIETNEDYDCIYS